MKKYAELHRNRVCKGCQGKVFELPEGEPFYYLQIRCIACARFLTVYKTEIKEIDNHGLIYAEMVHKEVVRQRLTKKLQRLVASLENPLFLSKAPQKTIENTRHAAEVLRKKLLYVEEDSVSDQV